MQKKINLGVVGLILIVFLSFINHLFFHNNSFTNTIINIVFIGLLSYSLFYILDSIWNLKMEEKIKSWITNRKIFK